MSSPPEESNRASARTDQADPRARHLSALRLLELEDALERFPSTGRVLEIGAGAGWQALELQKRGYEVEAVDVEQSTYKELRVFPVREYDGVHLPFEDDSFDVIFSSNVLEHVHELDALLADMRRVLKPGGMAVHLMPTATWRLWETGLHPLFLAGRIGRKVFGSAGKKASTTHSSTPKGLEEKEAEQPAGADSSGESGSTQERLTGLARVRHILIPRRHGETGNVWTEPYHFRRGRWREMFRSNGWTLLSDEPGRLFYTGRSYMGPGLALPTRRNLSRVLGSACRIYVVCPGPATDETPAAAKSSSH